MTRMNRGFTLIELLVVLLIMGIVSTIALSLFGVFSQSSGIRGSADHVVQAINLARQNASNARRVHFVKFEGIKHDDALTGVMTIYDDVNKNRQLDPADQPIKDKPVELLRFVYFEKSPEWIGVGHSGDVIYPAGFTPTTSDQYLTGQKNEAPVGDIVLAMQGQPFYKVYMDVTSYGNIRHYFFNNE